MNWDLCAVKVVDLAQRNESFNDACKSTIESGGRSFVTPARGHGPGVRPRGPAQGSEVLNSYFSSAES